MEIYAENQKNSVDGFELQLLGLINETKNGYVANLGVAALAKLSADLDASIELPNDAIICVYDGYNVPLYSIKIIGEDMAEEFKNLIFGMELLDPEGDQALKAAIESIWEKSTVVVSFAMSGKLPSKSVVEYYAMDAFPTGSKVRCICTTKPKRGWISSPIRSSMRMAWLTSKPTISPPTLS